MAYKVFLSHSTRDQGLVVTLANMLSKFGIVVSVAEWYLSPGQRLDAKVFTELRSSDCVVILLTQNGIRSNWVQQEVGYALREGKPIIPLVEKGTAPQDLGALQSREYIEYDPYQPQQALIRLSTYVNSVKFEREEQQKLLAAAGIFFLLLLLFGGKK